MYIDLNTCFERVKRKDIINYEYDELVMFAYLGTKYQDLYMESYINGLAKEVIYQKTLHTN